MLLCVHKKILLLLLGGCLSFTLSGFLLSSFPQIWAATTTTTAGGTQCNSSCTAAAEAECFVGGCCLKTGAEGRDTHYYSQMEREDISVIWLQLVTGSIFTLRILFWRNSSNTLWLLDKIYKVEKFLSHTFTASLGQLCGFDIVHPAPWGYLLLGYCFNWIESTIQYW